MCLKEIRGGYASDGEVPVFDSVLVSWTLEDTEKRKRPGILRGTWAGMPDTFSALPVLLGFEGLA